jgi:polyhydroxyalkanoate synthesis regulator phasin
MLEGISRMMFAGLGVIGMTRDRAEKFFDEAVTRGQADKENRGKFVQDMVDAAEQTRQDMEKLVAEQVRKVADQMNLATREDLARLEKKLDQCCRQD